MKDLDHDCGLARAECIRRHPALVYDHPSELVSDARLSFRQRREALRRWRHDASAAKPSWDEFTGERDGSVLADLERAHSDLAEAEELAARDDPEPRGSIWSFPSQRVALQRLGTEAFVHSVLNDLARGFRPLRLAPRMPRVG